jgi:Na+/proline symporter
MLSTFISWPIVCMFLLIGLLLFIFYDRPDIMGDLAPTYTIDRSEKIFIEFIRHEIPTGLRGLMLAGLFASAMSSLDSELNAMASTSVADFYRPWRKKRDLAYVQGNRRELVVSRCMIGVFAVLLATFASLCVWWHGHSGQKIIDFALEVMVFAYSGLLAVFLAALLTNRGSGWSVIAALITGFVSVLAMRPALWGSVIGLTAEEITFKLGFPWQMLIATTLAFIVCCLGNRRLIRASPSFV